MFTEVINPAVYPLYFAFLNIPSVNKSPTFFSMIKIIFSISYCASI
ncbi:hypothetical protein HMPREF0208_03320 [Citrobacter koseri]|nr:hypothetical protein HMPREF3207_01694 [Citrobacter koseri]KXA03784.1 hypothetical protein HMPREF3220_00391 [Citrobacter koseri]KXB41790.1 hypothetical protein HMPREF0208_03320 [Citrobacter koseri]